MVMTTITVMFPRLASLWAELMPSKLFDAAHLRSATGGNAALQREVIALFFTQTHDLLARLGDSADHWPMLAHTIKGSARNVGAVAIALAAERVETVLGDHNAAVAAIADLGDVLAASRAEMMQTP